MSEPSVRTQTQSKQGKPAAGGRRLAIGIAILVGSMVVLNLLAHGLDDAVGGGEPKGQPGSSYATTPEGLQAYSTLLHRYGHAVRGLRGDLVAQRLDPAGTVVVADPAQLSDDDVNALLQFVTGGGRLIAAGLRSSDTRLLRDDPPTFSSRGANTYTRIDDSLPRIRTVRTAAHGVWTDPGRGRVLVSDGPGALLVAERVGRGEIFWLADSAPLHNAYLDRADNAGFAIALAGEAGRPVAFAEGVHGVGQHSGLGAIPTRWKLSLLGLGFAALVLMLARGRRFGPPDRPSRELPPPRARYVEALSTTLERTRQPSAALVGMQQHARDRIATRASLRREAERDEIDGAARALGLNDDEREALFAPPATDRDVLALGDASAHVANAERGSR